MKRTYKYRLYANHKTLDNASRWLELCRNLYNAALEQRMIVYKQNKHCLYLYDQQKELPELKKTLPEYQQVDAQALQQVLRRLDNTYRFLFGRAKNLDARMGFPRFKSQHRYGSFDLKQNSWKMNGKYLDITRVGRFKLRLSRPIGATVKTITIKRVSSGKWYAYFVCDNVVEKRLSESDRVVGIDVGIKSFLVDSDGNKIDNPKFFFQSEAYLKRCHKRKDRRIKGSKRRNKARIILAKAYERIHNQRLDFLHKVANHYISNYGIIVFEDLAIKNLLKNRYLSKSIGDVCWGTFYGFCAYKAEEAGRQIVRIPRFEPSSKMCSECGVINQDLTLNDRQWVCKSCGALHDRDYNAAKNIRRVGQTLQEVTYAVAQSVS